VIHLDKIFWKPGWVESSKNEFIEKVQKIISKNDNWIIEGNYRSTFSIRFASADTIIFLDYKRRVCVYQSFKRYYMYRKKKQARYDFRVL